MQQTGARFLYNQKKKQARKQAEPVILNSIKKESVLVRLSSGAVKRVK